MFLRVLADAVKRKILVLDLDETLIHSHHDVVLRPSVHPGTPPDFILKVRNALRKIYILFNWMRPLFKEAVIKF